MLEKSATVLLARQDLPERTMTTIIFSPAQRRIGSIALESCHKPVMDAEPAIR
jgi:hypothetical protein